MADTFDANGLTVKTRPEIVDELQQNFRDIYGADINLDQNSPDGQIIGIIAQMATDIREKLVEINNSFDPDNAVGRILDERVAINNVDRAGASFTTINIDITVDRTVSLQGLDADYASISGTGFTVQDNAGNQFILIDSITITAGTHSLPFRAKDIGAVETTIGTINIPVTVVLGVTTINNPSAPLNIGVNEESDPSLRLRRSRSVALSSNGYLNGIEGQLFAIEGVTDCRVYENDTDTTDGNGTPEHCMWAIVEGGANEAIGNVIYQRKSYGCNMRGAVSVNILRPSGDIFTAKFDRPSSDDIYIQFEIKQTQVGFAFDTDFIKNYIEENLSYMIGEFADTSDITVAAIAAIAAQGGGGVPINVEISDDGYSWVDYLSATSPDSKWVVDSANITITVIS